MRFKNVPGYNGIYQVSDEGLIRTCRRPGKKKNQIDNEWRIMSPSICKTTGYLSISLTDTTSKVIRYRIHKLVVITFIGTIPNGMQIHHKDHNKVNNKLSNLQVVSRQENTRHSLKQKTPTTSKYKGVHYAKGRTKCWCAQISLNGTSTHIECFENETDAARAYNEAALLHFGEFALINPVDS